MLAELGYELLATEGTYRTLKTNGIPFNASTRSTRVARTSST